MPRILMLATYPPGRNASQRCRFEQYAPYWLARGWAVDYIPLLTETEARRLHQPGKPHAKVLALLRGAARRWQTLDRRKLAGYDLLFIQREAFLLGTAFFERQLARLGPPVIYDFDDALWVGDVSAANRFWGWLKRPGKLRDLLRTARLVIAGNPVLADYARPFHPRVEVIPTTIDTDRYTPALAPDPESPVTIGWMGSPTTAQYLAPLRPVYRALRQEFGDRVRFEVVGAPAVCWPEVGLRGRPWSLATEVADLQGFDLGVMPLPDTPWTRGKCGFKALQYLGVGRPAVVSPVGVNTAIIQHGANGLLASTAEDWYARLATLIRDPVLRQRLGRAGRQVVEAGYSVRRWRDRYLELFAAVGMESGS